MGKQLSPLEKEFLIKTYRAKTEMKLSDFCQINDVSETSMRKWMKQYEEGDIEGLSRAGEMGDVLPEGIGRTGQPCSDAECKVHKLFHFLLQHRNKSASRKTLHLFFQSAVLPAETRCRLPQLYSR